MKITGVSFSATDAGPDVATDVRIGCDVLVDGGESARDVLAFARRFVFDELGRLAESPQMPTSRIRQNLAGIADDLDADGLDHYSRRLLEISDLLLRNGI